MISFFQYRATPNVQNIWLHCSSGVNVKGSDNIFFIKFEGNDSRKNEVLHKLLRIRDYNIQTSLRPISLTLEDHISWSYSWSYLGWLLVPCLWGLEVSLPCHPDEVSLQTHGCSLFLEVPTTDPVCSTGNREELKLVNHLIHLEITFIIKIKHLF